MGITEAALRVLQITHKIPLHLPLTIVPRQNEDVHERLRLNKYYAQSLVHRLAWKSCKIGIIFMSIFLFCFRVIPLAATVSSARGTILIEKLEELGVHMFFIAMGLASTSCYRTIERNQAGFCFVINETLKLHEFACRMDSSLNLYKGAVESFTYAVAVAFYICPIIALLFPFVRPYDPIQWTMHRYFDLDKSNFPLKISAGIVYALNVAHGIHVALMALDLLGSCVDCGQRISAKLVNVLKEHTLNLKLPPKSVINLQFTQRLKLNQKLRIFLTLFNSVFEELISVMVCMCMHILIWCSCLLIRMWGILPLALYSNCGLIALGALYALFFFVRLASSLHINGEEFRNRWRRYLVSKKERAQLRSCPEIGFAVYPVVKYVRGSTALVISNLILNYTATLVILRST
ncbi:unnamed protein product [Orchesella dallaii]|uniref:Odorant receptor n=1 Tax=Orchesella dallaii TaxID=48710 RepID=A0ABP1RJS6_9HEXA